jgi:hypothetical protein
VSVARCSKCKGLLPAWLEAGDPANAKCPNCGHVNDLAAARTPAPQPQTPPKSPLKSTNQYASLEAQGGTKSPSLNKTMFMGSGTAKAPEVQKAAALAKTMMAPPTPPPQATPQKRTPTLPSLGSTEILPAPVMPAKAAPLTPAPVTTPPPVSVPAPVSLPALGPTPEFAAETDADISVEIDTPPPVPGSKESLPSWAVPPGIEDLGTTEPDISPVAIMLRARSTKIAAAAVGLVGLVITVVLLTRGGKPRAPIAVEVRKPPVAPLKIETPEPAPAPAPAPVAAEPARPTPPPVAARTAPPRPAPKAVEAPKPRPVAAVPAPEKPPAPERKVVVASAKHVAAATTPEPARRSGLPSEEDQRLAREAYARGNAQLFQGHVDQAIAAFKESLKLDGRNPAAQRGLGLAYVQAGNAPQAVVFLKKYLKASPTASDRPMIEKRIEQLSAR